VRPVLFKSKEALPVQIPCLAAERALRVAQRKQAAVGDAGASNHDGKIVFVPPSEAPRLSDPRCRMKCDASAEGKGDMQIIRVEQEGLRGSAGHGIDFYVSDRTADTALVALVRGFAWYRGDPETGEVFVRPPDDVYSAEFLAEAKQAIAEFLGKREARPPGWVTETLYQYPNCW
jgi:hypothetical protein